MHKYSYNIQSFYVEFNELSECAVTPGVLLDQDLDEHIHDISIFLFLLFLTLLKILKIFLDRNLIQNRIYCHFIIIKFDEPEIWYMLRCIQIS